MSTLPNPRSYPVQSNHNVIGYLIFIRSMTGRAMVLFDDDPDQRTHIFTEMPHVAEQIISDLREHWKDREKHELDVILMLDPNGRYYKYHFI